jgi:5'(3')-deoxyribonucleotidase
MQILLKDILSEITSTEDPKDTPLKVQLYVDLDGVLADMDKGFMALSGGYNTKNYKDKFGGDSKLAQKNFWKLVDGKKDYWISLDLMPDAMVLWKFLMDSFKDPVPVISSAGQGSTLAQQKTEWVHKHFGPSVHVIIAPRGVDKPNYIINNGTPTEGQYVTNVLIDDTQKNINAWDNEPKHRIGILHKNAADTIKALQPFINKQ